MSYWSSLPCDTVLSFIRDFTWRRRWTRVAISRGRTPWGVSDGGGSGIGSSPSWGNWVEDITKQLFRVHKPLQPPTARPWWNRCYIPGWCWGIANWNPWQGWTYPTIHVSVRRRDHLYTYPSFLSSVRQGLHPPVCLQMALSCRIAYLGRYIWDGEIHVVGCIRFARRDLHLGSYSWVCHEHTSVNGNEGTYHAFPAKFVNCFVSGKICTLTAIAIW